MKIFITGITGLLGRYVAEYCSNAGHEIVAFVRDNQIKQANFHFDLDICYGDITRLDSIPINLQDSEIIVHCAADTNMFSLRNSKQAEVNIQGVRNLVMVSKQVNIKKFIHISSANTIQHGDQKNPADETVKLKSANDQLPYVNSKIMAEEILLREFRNNNFPVIILNPTFMLGPKDFNRSSGKLILAAIKEHLLLYPGGGKSIVDARDVAQAVINSLHSGTIGNNYLLSNENLTYKEIVTMACQYAHVPAPKYQISDFLAMMIGFFGTGYELITGKSIAVNYKTMKLATENHYYNPHKAIIDLAFSPRSASETIRDTVNWFQNEYIPYQDSRDKKRH